MTDYNKENDGQHEDVTIELENDGVEEKIDIKLKKLRDELKKVKTEKAENLEGWQRSKADYVNLSRRMREQEEFLVQNSTAKIARSVVTVFDSLEAAYKSAEEGNEVLKGIEQVIKQLESALKEHGIIRFTPKSGDDFDPSMHEPVNTVATKEQKEDNTISETFQSGYETSDMVIRPARVSVKKYN